MGAIVILAVAARVDAWLLSNRYGRDDGVVPFVGVNLSVRDMVSKIAMI